MGKPSSKEVSRPAGECRAGRTRSPGPLDAVILPLHRLTHPNPHPPPRVAGAGQHDGYTQAEKDPQMTAEWRRVRLLYPCGLRLVLLSLFFLVG